MTRRVLWCVSLFSWSNCFSLYTLGCYSLVCHWWRRRNKIKLYSRMARSSHQTTFPQPPPQSSMNENAPPVWQGKKNKKTWTTRIDETVTQFFFWSSSMIFLSFFLSFVFCSSCFCFCFYFCSRGERKKIESMWWKGSVLKSNPHWFLKELPLASSGLWFLTQVFKLSKEKVTLFKEILRILPFFSWCLFFFLQETN